MRKKKVTISEQDKRHLATLDPGGYPYKTYLTYAELSAKHEALCERLSDPKFENKDGQIPEKHRDEFRTICQEIDQAHMATFRAFDNAMRTAERTFHVPEDEAQQIIYDALMGNAESMPDEYLQLDGLQRGREFQRVAIDIVSLLKGSKVEVTDEDMGAPYCDECRQTLS